MAEYGLMTGKTIWQRVVNVSQRERVEKWLVQNYPVKLISPLTALLPVRAIKKRVKK